MNKDNVFYEGSFAFMTDKGKVRENNEDRAMILTNAEGDALIMVADGMGGSNKGDLASEMAALTMREEFAEKKHFLNKARNKFWLMQTIKKANKEIYDKSQQDISFQGMGTTLNCCMIVGDTLYLANLGDSRAYLDDGKKLIQISEDETYANYLAKTSQISVEESKSLPERHVLMNALGIYPSLSLQVEAMPYSGEKILACTDGLYNQMGDDVIHAIISTNERPDQKVSTLIGTANASGGSDNIGVAYWETIND